MTDVKATGGAAEEGAAVDVTFYVTTDGQLRPWCQSYDESRLRQSDSGGGEAMGREQRFLEKCVTSLLYV